MPAEVTADVPAAERQALYAGHSCLFVTTRILVVDLLSGRVAAGQIAAMVVLNAHRWGAGCCWSLLDAGGGSRGLAAGASGGAARIASPPPSPTSLQRCLGAAAGTPVHE